MMERGWSDLGRAKKRKGRQPYTHCITYHNSPVFSTGRWWSSKTPWKRFIFCSKIIQYTLNIPEMFKEMISFNDQVTELVYLFWATLFKKWITMIISKDRSKEVCNWFFATDQLLICLFTSSNMQFKKMIIIKFVILKVIHCLLKIFIWQ